MKTIFDAAHLNEIKARIEKIEASAEPRWGKMNVKQMLKHCVENERLLLREKKFKDVFIGRIFGKMALKSDVKDDKPFSKSSPTHPDLKVTGEVQESLDQLKKEWTQLLEKYAELSPGHYDDFVHPFFRKMSDQQVGIWALKHADHHLRQFGY
ncbi:MAG: DinB family protein [Bacteroidota bacterium]